MKRTLLAIMIGAISTGLAGGALAQDNGDDELNDGNDAALTEEPNTTTDESSGMGTGTSASSMAGDNELDESLRDRDVSEIEDMTVVNQNDEEIGDVQNVVKDDETGILHVVVTIGGLWGMGGSDVVLPLADMQLLDDQLVIQRDYGEEELEESAEEYDEERYSEVDDDVKLSDA
ncbi:PRC-barrel domain-containing protein [Billgrantia sp. LNSP4103-1]|uniref:PRC-barrel domain-containing protein n=1 Tax=Billgrantia sp. LNSP4103-1 TaxID=3410266 RepID=UPI00403EFA80